MAKKLIMLGMAVAAVAAFAMPAVASASPELVDHEGKVAKNAPIIGTSFNAVTTNTALGELTCNDVQITGIVDENSGSSIKGHGVAGETTTCFASGVPLTVTAPTLVTMSTSGGHSGTLTLTFIADVGPFECHFEGTGGFTYGTGTEANELSIAGISLSGDEICEPEEGSPEFHGDFALTTEATGEPIWVQ